MAGILGMLAAAGSDNSFVSVAGQKLVYDLLNDYYRAASEDLMKAYACFIETDTEDHIERYKLPGGGRLQERGGQAQSGAVKQNGSWDVAYPLKEWGASIWGDDVTLAYMTPQELDQHVTTVQTQMVNTVRFEVLRRLFNSSTATFVDERKGSLTVQPLANGDSVVYPPVLGSESEATENHYLESNYAASAISDTNNPLITIRDELEEHFGTPSGFGNIAVFINSAQVAKIEALTDYDQVNDSYKQFGANRDTINGTLPAVPGRVIGRSNGVWVVEWRWIPSGWCMGVNLDAPAPLKRRVDTAASGLPRDLQLVARETISPLVGSHYRMRMGVGVGNRLNGVALEFGTGGTYTVPTAYA